MDLLVLSFTYDNNTMISNQKLGAVINLLHSLHKYSIPYLNCYGSTFLGVNVMRKCVMLIKCNDTTHANFWNFSQRIRKGPFVNYISIFLTCVTNDPASQFSASIFLRQRPRPFLQISKFPRQSSSRQIIRHPSFAVLYRLVAHLS